MHRTIQPKWLLGALLALPMVIAPAIVAFLIRPPAESRAPPARSSQLRKLVATVPDETVTKEAYDFSEDIARRRQAYAEEARRKTLKKYNTWQGTKTGIATRASIEGRGAYNAVVRAFNSDCPAPEDRQRLFAHFIGGQPEYKCVGWSVGVVSVSPNKDGWEATVHVRPVLASLSWGGVLYTPQNTVEKWQIAHDGTATIVDVRAGDGPPIIMGD